MTQHINVPADARPKHGAAPRQMPLRAGRPSSQQVLTLTGLLVLALLMMVAACLWWSPGVDGVRMSIRATARTSLGFFLLAYGASAAHGLWPGKATRWLRQFRRQWGWLLVISHTLHAIGIYAFSQMAPDQFQVPLATWITGSIAYVMLWAMGATSFDRTAAWLGRTAWSRLHTWGSHYLCLSFLLGNAKRIGMEPAYLLPTLLLLSVIALRSVAARRRRADPTSAAPT